MVRQDFEKQEKLTPSPFKNINFSPRPVSRFSNKILRFDEIFETSNLNLFNFILFLHKNILGKQNKFYPIISRENILFKLTTKLLLWNVAQE